MTEWDERLVRMANDIARNFAALGQDNAVAATADHLASFWDRRMKEKVFEVAAGSGSGLSPLARAAVQMLMEHGKPPPQTQATGQIPGASDAG